MGRWGRLVTDGRFRRKDTDVLHWGSYVSPSAWSLTIQLYCTGALIRLYHRIFWPIHVRQTVFRIIRISRCLNWTLGTYLGFEKSQFGVLMAEIL